jgi:hypothetical protein
VSSTKLFFKFVKEGILEIRENISKYWALILVLIIIGNLEECYKAFGGQEGDSGTIAISIITIVLTMIITAKVILMNKRNVTTKDKLIYILIPFLLYSFYYSLIFLLGIVLLFVPGFWALVFLSQAPLIAALSPNGEKIFMRSIALVKKNIKLVIWISVSSILLEFMSLALTPIASSQIRLILNALISVPDAFFTVAITTASVRIYYYLESQ